MAIAAAALYSVYIVVGSQVRKDVTLAQSAGVIFAAAGMSAGVLMVASGPRFPSTGAGWAATASMVGISTILSVVTFLVGLERIGPTSTAMVSMLEPVVTVLLGYWWLDETLARLTLMGGGLILLAVPLLAQSELRRSEPVAVGESNPGE
jgi:drug/metabolite transporter (DMT)-like permease